LGKVSDQEMRRVFNLGIGFICIVDPGECETLIQALRKSGTVSVIIGHVV
jgi:phosphoribosylaminoimidazole (AIR) synthetase